MFHDCGKERGIGYFLEPLLLLSIFSKTVRLLHMRIYPC
jgi:hypothetical protein